MFFLKSSWKWTLELKCIVLEFADFSPESPGWGLDKEAMLNVSSLDI